ncbi:MAG: VWA domain-containing protein [Anaerolineae bacterium]|nr:VWA domain-containing protein [Anaerolineae bacterium]
MKADFVLDYNVIAVERAQHVYLMARIQAEAAPATTDRHPLNLSVVLDRSGSMQGDKLAYVKQAAQFLVQRLGAQDRVSIVTYDSSVNVDVPAQPVIEKDRINQIIEQLKAGNLTNLSGGWLQGCQLVAAEKADGQVNRVLLLTDGLANRGVTDPAKLEALARQKRAQGITTTTMGVGLDFNEDLLTRMAAEGGGAFYFIDNPDLTADIFEEELRGLLSVIGQNLVITLILSPDVQMVRQLNAYPSYTLDSDQTKPSIAFKLGDLFSDELKTLVLELSIPALKNLGRVEVAHLRFEYDELQEDGVEHRVIEVPVWVNVAQSTDAESQLPDPAVTKAALLLEAARAREDAIKEADRGEFETASQILKNTADKMRASGLTDDELDAQHDMLREEAVDMDLGHQRYTDYERKSSMTKSFTSSTRPMDTMATVALHGRLKQSRNAVERKGDRPVKIVWRNGSLDLKDKIDIGRGDDNDIVIADPAVSTYHCAIIEQDGDYFLHDLNSTNGTFANGGRVSGHFRISVGDVVTVGSQLFMFEGAKEPSA